MLLPCSSEGYSTTGTTTTTTLTIKCRYFLYFYFKRLSIPPPTSNQLGYGVHRVSVLYSRYRYITSTFTYIKALLPCFMPHPGKKIVPDSNKKCGGTGYHRIKSTGIFNLLLAAARSFKFYCRDSYIQWAAKVLSAAKVPIARGDLAANLRHFPLGQSILVSYKRLNHSTSYISCTRAILPTN
jgi:hypothetical protein